MDLVHTNHKNTNSDFDFVKRLNKSFVEIGKLIQLSELQFVGPVSIL